MLFGATRAASTRKGLSLSVASILKMMAVGNECLCGLGDSEFELEILVC